MDILNLDLLSCLWMLDELQDSRLLSEYERNEVSQALLTQMPAQVYENKDNAA